MSCSPGAAPPKPRVDSPRVRSRLARSMKSFRPRVESKSFSIGNIWESQESSQVQDFFSDRWMDGWLSCNKARCQTNPVDQCVKQSSWLVDESRWWLKSDDSSIDPSTSTKHRESDIRRLDSHSGRNDFRLQANRLRVRAKRLRAKRTSGETTVNQPSTRQVREIV